MQLVRTSTGGILTPSVVRIDKRGAVVVGDRARRLRDSDPLNTRSEFKRLMGTSQPLEFPGAGVSRKPEELSAEVLRALRNDVRDQAGVEATRAVVTVPALFEVPQSAATSEAARLAGFEEVELLQEPVASAIASGWSAETHRGYWLVYDLGGGTFDASLLETKDGFLRVVGHDGDNFLGGKDLDSAIVAWMIDRIVETDSIQIRTDDPEHAMVVALLRSAAEEAKQELSRTDRTSIVAGGLVIGDEVLDVDMELDRATLEALCRPVIDRSIDVCRRLLENHRVGGKA